MLRINQLKLPVSHTPDQLREKLLQNLRIREKELKQYTVRKRSLDARKKPELYYVYTIDFMATDEERLLKRLRGKVQRVKEIPYAAPAHGSEKMTNRPVVVGALLGTGMPGSGVQRSVRRRRRRHFFRREA